MEKQWYHIIGYSDGTEDYIWATPEYVLDIFRLTRASTIISYRTLEEMLRAVDWVKVYRKQQGRTF